MPNPKQSVESILHPGKTNQVDAAKYDAMKTAILAALPSAPPGLTVADLTSAVKPSLPDTLFPGGSTAGWWVKCVQLDLEAKQVIVRTSTTPLRLRRV